LEITNVTTKKSTKKTKANGFVLYEDNTIVVIATGVYRKSTNRKTGSMIQVYILHRHIHPIEAIRTGADAAVCLDCIHRGTAGYQERSCYVDMKGVASVWRAYQRGRYPYLPMAEYGRVFKDRAVRLGTYGEPALIPLEIVRAIVVLSERHSGYTHQWGRIDGEFMQFLMASVDRPGDATVAHGLGYRTFRVNPGEYPVAAGEVICPSESRDRNCVDCRLCNGATSGAKSVMISVHGIGAKHLETKLLRQDVVTMQHTMQAKLFQIGVN
jgi:hypothetical protein